MCVVFPLIWRPCRKGAPWREIQIGRWETDETREKRESARTKEWAGHGKTRDSGPREPQQLVDENWPPEGRWGLFGPGVQLRNSLSLIQLQQPSGKRPGQKEREKMADKRERERERKKGESQDRDWTRHYIEGKRRRNEPRARMHNNRFATIERGKRERTGVYPARQKRVPSVWVWPGFPASRESIPWPQTVDLLPTPIFSSFSNAFFFFLFLSIAIAISKRSDLSSFWKNKTRFESGPTIIDFAYVIECRLRQLYDDDDGGEKGCHTHTHTKSPTQTTGSSMKRSDFIVFFPKGLLRSSTKEVIVGKLMSLPPINPTQIR